MSRLYPAGLCLKGRHVLVVGAGSVALRKVKDLLRAGAIVTVVGLSACRGIEELASAKKVKFFKRSFKSLDLKNKCLVIAATSDRMENERAAKECMKRGIFVNVVDDPSLCTFQVPACSSKGELTISVSTGGAAPGAAGFLRRILDREFLPVAYGYVEVVKSVRSYIMRRIKEPGVRRKVMMSLVRDYELYNAVKRKNFKVVDKKIKAAMGDELYRGYKKRWRRSS